jgi:hypothetical protein
MPKETKDVDHDSDLLVMLAVLAHQANIDAVAPQKEDVSRIYADAREYGGEVSMDMIVVLLKKAQMELLRRQLGE